MYLLPALWAVADKRCSIAVDVNSAVGAAAIKLHAEKLPPVGAGLLLIITFGATRWFTRCVEGFAGHASQNRSCGPVYPCLTT